MLGRNGAPTKSADPADGSTPPPPVTLLSIAGDVAKIEGKFEIADSLHVECEIGGELNVGGKLVIGEKGIVKANVTTVHAIIQGVYEGNMVASGDVEITESGRVSGNIETDSLVIAKGGVFTGNVVKKNGRESRPLHWNDEQRLNLPKSI
jgi:cytoskeletal protein CcmA (bactofilin family)